jgi:hypothetical protein
MALHFEPGSWCERRVQTAKKAAPKEQEVGQNKVPRKPSKLGRITKKK